MSTTESEFPELVKLYHSDKVKYLRTLSHLSKKNLLKFIQYLDCYNDYLIKPTVEYLIEYIENNE